MYLSVNKNYSKTDCKIAKAEKNDCVVRSIAAATGVSYRTAHAFCKEELGRSNILIMASQGRLTLFSQLKPAKHANQPGCGIKYLKKHNAAVFAKIGP